MPRLVAFGCSYTYGEALPDCYEPESGRAGPHPSIFAWPNVLADRLKLECVNRGAPAFSNAAILSRVLDFKFNHDDICVILWTFKSRDILFQPSGEHKNLGRWEDEWLKNQDMYDLVMKNRLHMHHAQSYLELQQIPFYAMDADYFKRHPLDHLMPTWARSIKLVNINFEEIENSNPKGLDNLHPGQGFHTEIANILYNEILKIN